MNTGIPKVFISYSWSCSEKVKELAERLISDGVDVVIDIAELKEGQDKYAFMERCVTDDTITKVLMICDKAYAEKANKREGGVGDETVVISAEVYGKAKQEKFVPLIFERDEEGKEYVPAYLKSRIYIDLSNVDNYEENYDKLLRNLYDKPEWRKPTLGKMPEYLNEENVSLVNVRAAIKQIQAFDGKSQTKLDYSLRKFNESFVCAFIELSPQLGDNFAENLMKQIEAVKPLRDQFYDFVEVIAVNVREVDSVLGEFFEELYNKAYSTDGRSSFRDADFEFGLFLVWEMFIGATALLLHHKCYNAINGLLTRTYFLNNSPFGQNVQPTTFQQLRLTKSYIEDVIKPRSEKPNLLCLAADLLQKREKLPILTSKAIVEADIILYQLSDALGMTEQFGRAWFPRLYVYLSPMYGGGQDIWTRMVSAKHCEKILPLFGVRTIDEMKEVVQKNKDNGRDMRYQDSFDTAPTILHSIKLENIARLS